MAIRVTVKVCKPQETAMVGVTRYSTDDLESSDQFEVTDMAELRTRLATYTAEGAIVYINDIEAGPSYAAADNFEYTPELFQP